MCYLGMDGCRKRAVLLAVIIHTNIWRIHVKVEMEFCAAKEKQMIWPCLFLNKEHSHDWCVLEHCRICIYSTKRPSKGYSQMGTYWKCFIPHGFLDYFIDFVCIVLELAEINDTAAMTVEYFSSQRHLLRCLYPHPAHRAFHLPLKQQNGGNYTGENCR